MIEGNKLIGNLAHDHRFDWEKMSLHKWLQLGIDPSAHDSDDLCPGECVFDLAGKAYALDVFSHVLEDKQLIFKYIPFHGEKKPEYALPPEIKEVTEWKANRKNDEPSHMWGCKYDELGYEEAFYDFPWRYLSSSQRKQAFDLLVKGARWADEGEQKKKIFRFLILDSVQTYECITPPTDSGFIPWHLLSSNLARWCDTCLHTEPGNFHNDQHIERGVMAELTDADKKKLVQTVSSINPYLAEDASKEWGCIPSKIADCSAEEAKEKEKAWRRGF